MRIPKFGSRRARLTRSRAGALAAIGAAWCLGACGALSVAPVVGEGDALEVPGLAGTWLSEDGDTATLTRGKPGEYALMLGEDEGRSSFSARSGRLGNRLVLDVWPELEENRAAGLTETLLGTVIPGHLLVVVELAGDRLRAALIEPDSLKAAIRGGAVRLPLLELEEQGALVLTAPTDALRAALAPYLERGGALGEWSEWTRLPAAAAGGNPPGARD